MNNRILIVDDNEAIHEDFRKILNPQKNLENDYFYLEEELFGETVTKNINEVENNYELDFACSGEIAYQMVEKSYLENNPYALMFIDVRMPPGMNGIETISMIWEKYPDIEVVICSAYSDYSWEEIIKKLGENDKLLFLKKPFEAIEVKQMTLSLVKKYNLNQKVKNYVLDLENEVNKRTKQLKAMLKELLENKDKMKQDFNIRKDLEKSIEYEKNNLFSILNKMEYGIIYTDTDDNILFINDKLKKLLSKNKEDIIDKNILEVLKIKDIDNNQVNIKDIDKNKIYKLNEYLVSINNYKIDNKSEIQNIFLIKEIEDEVKLKDIIKIIQTNIDLFKEKKDFKYIEEIDFICNKYLKNYQEDNKKEFKTNKSVLICDTSRDIAKLLKRIINELQIKSELVEIDKIEEEIKNENYDFIILDYYILNKINYDLIKKIKEINDKIKIIVSIPIESKNYFYLSDQIHNLIYKPFDLENIKKALY